MTAEKAIYIRLKDNIPKYKSKRFLKHVHERYPGLELHHLTGSHTGSKTTDFLILPLTREEHIQAEKCKSQYAIDNLHISLTILLDYVHYLEGKVK